MTALRHIMRDAIIARANQIAVEQCVDLSSAIQRATDERFEQLCARLDANAQHRSQRLAPTSDDAGLQAAAPYQRWDAPWMARK